MRHRFRPKVGQAKARPRATIRAGRATVYTPAKTASYESLVALAGQQAMAGRPPLAGPLSLQVTAVFPVPPSWPKAKREAARFHTSRPDLDNLLKAVLDGLNAVAWLDDAQVCDTHMRKVYGPVPGVTVQISKATTDMPA